VSAARTPSRRWLLWLALLAGAAALAFFGDKTPPGSARPAARPTPTPGPSTPATPPRPRATAAVLEPIEWLLPRAELAAAALPPRADLFATPAWRQPAPPPVAKAAPPPASAPPPAAPPQPYTVIGKKFEAGAWELFLGRADNAFVLREGDSLEAAWRVEKIEPPKATLRHLSTGQAQTLDIGPAP
jgi:hypothetical protein